MVVKKYLSKVGSKTKEIGRSLLDKIPQRAKDYGKVIAKGVAFGTAIDTLLYQAACEYNALAQPSPLEIPGYVAGGTHYDDLIGLGIGAAVTIDGIRKKNLKQAVLGGIMTGSMYVASQYQYGPLR